LSEGPSSPRRLVLVGCGRMGGALLRGWLDGGVAAPGAVAVVEPEAAPRAAAAALGVRALDDAGALGAEESPDLVLFAVKPQAMAAVLPAYGRFAGGATVFLSIAAGKATAFFERILGAGGAAVPVVRAMPNTPAQVGRGITALYATAAVDDAQRTLCETLMGAVGEVLWLDDEGLMDAVTAVSGSGPAYVFLLIECLAEAARAAGLPDDIASRLARATVTGAAELARLSEDAAAELRRQVTSPGGTTAAALEVLTAAGGLRDLMTRAVAAAAARSRALAD